MIAEGATEFDALEEQAAKLLRILVSRGYERVAPSCIQPASLLLDFIGEALRARTYVFRDHNGEELCLRPDLTIPVARVFLERNNYDNVNLPQKFCYNGPAFRIPDERADRPHLREFRQAGIEYFGDGGSQADLEVLLLTIEAIRSAGVRDFTLRLGHVGIFNLMLEALQISRPWRSRIAHALLRPGDFSNEIKALTEDKSAAAVGYQDLINNGPLTEQSYFNYLDAHRIGFIGLRKASEIIERIKEQDAERSSVGLDAGKIELITNYTKISDKASAALLQIEKLAQQNHPAVTQALQYQLKKLHDLLINLNAHSELAPPLFAADFGHQLGYYTGLVFQIEVTHEGETVAIAGGGRYDNLVKALSGGVRDVPAVGAAIHTENLLRVTLNG